VSGATLGVDPPGLTLKFSPVEGAGALEALLPVGATLSEGAVVSDDVVSCAKTAGGNSGATITTKVIIASAFEDPFFNLFNVIKNNHGSASESTDRAAPDIYYLLK
jgi:hypothetical protein